MIQLAVSSTGSYQVMFGYEDDWEQRQGHLIHATGPREAVALAFARGLWEGAPLEGPRGNPRPIRARVRYEVDNPEPGKCMVTIGTRAFNRAVEYERLPVFWATPLGDLRTPAGWEQRPGTTDRWWTVSSSDRSTP